MYYNSLQSKLDLTKIRLKEKLAENPARIYFFLKLKIFFYELLISIAPAKAVFSVFKKFAPEIKETAKKFFILVFFDPSKSFSALVAECGNGNCPYSYSAHKNYQKRVRIFSAGSTGIIALIIALIISSTFFSSPTRAATYTFTQTSWSGGATVNNATHTSNQTGWTEYSAKDTNLTTINTGADLQLAQVASSVTQTSESDFNGTNSNTQVSGTGSSTSLGLVGVSNNNILAFYKLNDGSGTTAIDSSGNNNNSTLINGPTWVAGKTGTGALSFDGSNDYMDNPNITLSGAFTFTGWFNWSSAMGDILFDLNGACGGGNYILYVDATNYFIVSTLIGAHGGLTQGQWYFIALTRNSSNLVSGYKNATLIGTTTKSGSLNFTSITCTGFPFGGEMDDIRIFNRALSSSEISTIYNSGNGMDGFYSLSGTYESSTIDLIQQSNFSTLAWNATVPAQTGANAFRVQMAVDTEGDGPWNYVGTDGTSGTYFTSSGSSTPSALNGYRYVRYKLYFQTADTAYTPTLDDITLNSSQSPYPASATLTSSAYNSTDTTNVIGALSWTEDASLPTGTTLTVSLRTATSSANLTSSSWSDFTNATTNCSKTTGTVTCPLAAIPASLKDGTGDQWFQYKVALTSTGTSTPTLSDITITYVVNSPPEFDATYGTRGITVNSQASDGTITFLYKIRDPDTTSSTNQDPGAGFVSPSFEYSTNGGGSWTTITGGFSSGATTSKAVTEAGWNTYTVIWTPTSTPSLSGTYTVQAQLRITLNDGEAANNTVSTTSAQFTLDAKNPTVSVNPRITATSTTPTLYFSTTDDSTLQMRVGLNSDLSDNLNWVSYANSTTTSLATDPDTAYIQFRDVYNNRTSIYSVATPETPTNFVVQDTSNTQTSEYRLFLAWQVFANSGTFASYRIYRSTDNGSTYSLLATITDRTVNYYLDQSLTASSTYYYKVASMDTSANGSYFSSPKQSIANGAQDAGEGGGGNPADTPVISSVSSGTTTTQSTTIIWQTKDVNNNAKLANSTVGYCSPAPCFSGYTTQGVASFVSSHSVVLRGLSPNTSYSYYVQSTDPYNNTASSTGYTFTTNSGPSISGVAVSDITDVSASITWNTNIAASGYVVYASSSPPSGYEAGWGTRDTARTVNLTGLTRGTKYWFYVKSQDIDSNWAYDYNVVNGETRYFDFTTSQDSTAPTISNITATSTTDTVSIIYWTTNEEATSQIEYGTQSGVYSNISPLNTGLNIAHYQKLDNLNQNTTYYYRVASVDGSRNSASSTEKTFLTLDAQIARSRAGEFSGGGGIPQIIYLTEVEQREKLEKQLAELAKRPEISKDDLAVLKKELDDLRLKTVSKDLYDRLNEEYEKLKADSARKSGSEEGKQKGGTQKPEEIIKALAIKFKEAILSFSGNLTVSETEEFINDTTESLEELSKIVPPPVMSAEPQIEIGSNYAVIQWKTNKEANSIVAYATDSAYSPTQSEPYTTQIGNSDELVKEHTVKLENLSPSTVYHYQMKSRAKLGDYAKSKDFTFITKAEAPRISDASIQRLGLTGAKVNWRTLTLADSLVKYTPVKNGVKLEKESKTEGEPNFVLIHELNLKNLEPDTGYFVEVFSKDSFGNIESKSLGSFFTSKDTASPFISQVKIENSILPGQEGRVQTIIAWKTDEPATSQIAYEQGANFKEMPQNLTPLDRNLTTSHTVVLTNFRAGILYRFRVISKDADGNEAQTKDYTVFTPQSAKGILEIILENFESTFGWTKKLGF